VFNPQDTTLPYNWIIYGAPGTGKSHYLDSKYQELQAKETIRVTFYSDYTYGQFVGGFRPAPLYDPGDTTLYLGRDSSEEQRPGLAGAFEQKLTVLKSFRWVKQQISAPLTPYSSISLKYVPLGSTCL
jgi:hypothetical protein